MFSSIDIKWLLLIAVAWMFFSAGLKWAAGIHNPLAYGASAVAAIFGAWLICSRR